MSKKEEALRYHEFPSPGKISVVPTKSCETALDLALAYSPGVAEPCLEIARDPEAVFRYTSKGNLVAVISNGSAVLGLGDLGPLGAKPVMEGKAILFKRFADIDSVDIELDCKDTSEFVAAVRAMAPTFGGINLEDIKAPECFEIETQLRAALDIPVFHDDQHGTAIIAGAALMNALDLTGRTPEGVRVVVNGAGAAGIACAKMLLVLGVEKAKIILCDSKGIVTTSRTDGMNPYKLEFASSGNGGTLADALKGADVFIGVSARDVLTPDMLQSMSENPIVFALANPDPEINYDLAVRTCPGVLMATGRSDFPNQVNNVLGFPYIFRGALDVRARQINDEMKLAAIHALAKLARESVPDVVRQAYDNSDFAFGPTYLIPKPFDPRVLYYVAPAVAEAAIQSGVARVAIDIEDYRIKLKGQQNRGRTMIATSYRAAKRATRKRVAYAEGSNPRVLKAALMAYEEGLCEPILIGRVEEIRDCARKCEINISSFDIIDPRTDSRREQFAKTYFEQRARHGLTQSDASRACEEERIFASLLLRLGDADAMICGVDQNFPDAAREVLRIVGLRPDIHTAAGLYMISIRDRLLFLADTTMNIEMTSEKLAAVAVMSAEFAQSMGIEPRIALLSFSNFGSVHHASAIRARDAVERIRALSPELMVDGEMWADTAVVDCILREHAPFSTLKEAANVLIFPDMQSGNIAYKLLQRLGGARVVGPVTLGLRSPAYIMQRYAGVDEIFNMTILAVHQASRNAGTVTSLNRVQANAR